MIHEIEQVAVEALIPYARNARTHSPAQVAQIAGSIREFGFINPVILDAENGIIAGHGRVMAAQQLGLATVPALRAAHLDDAQRRAYVLADNKLALNAGWDDELLRIELADLDADGFDMALTGFSDEEMAALLQDVEGPALLTDGEDAPEPPANPVTVAGDVWVCGDHRVMCGDSTCADAVSALMCGGLADMVFTDPPYGVNFKSGKADRFDALKNDDTILDIAPIVWQFMGDDTAAFIWTSHHVYTTWRAQFADFYNQTIVWSKSGFGMGDLRGSYALDYELALFCTKGRPLLRGDRGGAVWRINKDAPSSYVHPTQKPVELAERALADFSDAGGVVMDLFGGSGSTLVACERAGRRARLMELDQRYCDVIVRRWQEMTGRDAVLEATGETFNTKAGE